MAKVDLADGSRFAVIGDRDSDGGDTPLMFDPLGVVAVEAKGDGKFALHLVGGQTLVLRPAIAAAALKALGLSSAIRGQRPEAGGQGKQKLKRAQPAKPARAPRPRVKPKPKPKPEAGGFLPAAVARLFAAAEP